MTPYDAATLPSTRLAARPALIDGFGRTVSYLRVSVTDRCDLRCVYCMAEHMTFLPKAQVLTLEELDAIASGFVALGVRKLRLTGGEPLVRKGIMTLVERLARHLASGDLDELTLTTNGTQLAEHAGELARLGVRRINVSLDTLKPDLFARLTRGGDLARVLAGIEAAQAARAGGQDQHRGAEERQRRRDSGPDRLGPRRGHGPDPDRDHAAGRDRRGPHRPVPVAGRRAPGAGQLLDPDRPAAAHRRPGPLCAIEETGGRLGLITPLSHNFCEACNRVRLTCTGVLHSCLGQEDAADLRAVLRGGGGPDALEAAIRAAVEAKPKGHDFQIERGAAPALSRHMSRTGG